MYFHIHIHFRVCLLPYIHELWALGFALIYLMISDMFLHMQVSENLLSSAQTTALAKSLN